VAWPLLMYLGEAQNLFYVNPFCFCVMKVLKMGYMYAVKMGVLGTYIAVTLKI